MKNKKKSIQTSPIIALLVLILIISFLSLFLSIIKFDSTQTTIDNGILETSILVVKNIFSKEGFIYFFSSIINNFNIIEPFVYILLSIVAISSLKNSGFLKHIFSPFKKLKLSVITFIVVLIGIISSIIGEYSYIILLPLVAVMYQYLNRNPILGIITVFLGITLGYSTGIFYNYEDYALGVLTQASAVIDVDSSYRFNLYSTFYLMLFSTFVITFLLTFLIEKYLTKKFPNIVKYEDELKTSNKALAASLLTLGILFAVIIFMIMPNGLLIDQTQTHYVAKIFSPTSPFAISFMFIFLIISAIVSCVYGYVSKNFKDNQDFSISLTKEVNNLGYLFILMFLSSILLGIIDWTNIGVVITNKLISIISLFDFTGITLIIISFVLIIIMSIFLPSTIEKWALISPTLVPLFMRGNLTPGFAQFVFKIADSIGKSICPLFIYFIVLIGFIEMFNKDKKITMKEIFTKLWPIIFTMAIFWLVILIIWYVSGLPLGIDSFVTM